MDGLECLHNAFAGAPCQGLDETVRILHHHNVVIAVTRRYDEATRMIRMDLARWLNDSGKTVMTALLYAFGYMIPPDKSDIIIIRNEM